MYPIEISLYEIKRCIRILNNILYDYYGFVRGGYKNPRNIGFIVMNII